MRLLFILSILSLYIFAETIIGIGKAKPSYDNLSDAKEDAKTDAIKAYKMKKYSKYQSCLKEDFVVDEDNYNVFFINEKSVRITPKHIIVEAIFEVTETKNNLDIYFQDKCQKKRSHEKSVASVKDTLSHFHLGAGVMGWSGTYGGEVFFGYEADDWWSLHATYSHQRLLAMRKSDDTEISRGDTSNIGIEFSLHRNGIGILLGSDTVLKHKNSLNSKDITSAVTWGFFARPKDSKLEISLIFKEYNDDNSLHERSLSGGLRVRYKFF